MIRTVAFRLLAGTALAVAIAPLPLHAQEAKSPAPEAQDSPDIIVTATKREQRLQDVPVAISAVSGAEVAAAGVNNTEQLAQIAPSLFITSSQQVGLGAQIRLRGVGTATGNAGLEGSVGFFVDGVYVGRSNTAFGDLVDVERIEVLRGPQGTLFGKNTSAGVISVFTRAPDLYWGGNARVTLSNEGGIRASARLTGPIVDDKLAFSLSGQFNVRDGYVIDPVSGADYNNRNRWLVRGQLLFTPASNLSLRFIAENSQRDENSTVAPFIQITDAQRALIVALGGFVPNPPSGGRQLQAAINAPFTGRTNDTNFTGIADWTTSVAKFKAILGYRDAHARKNYDSDFTSLDLYRQNDDLHDRTFSAELQATKTAGPLDLLLGAYYFDAKTDYDVSRLLQNGAGAYYRALTTSTLITPGIFESGRGLTLQDTNQDGDGYSIFTHDVLHLASWLDVTGGLRYQWEKKTGGSTFTYNQATACTIVYAGTGAVGANAYLAAIRSTIFCAANTPNYQARYDDSRLTGTGIVSIKPTRDILLYASYARGFKAGGINLDQRAGANANQTFLPEDVDNYEIGLKTSFFHRKLFVNAAGFIAEYHNFQLNSFNPTTSFVLSNEGSVRSSGIEGEATVLPVKGLTLRGGFLYNIARYGQDTVNTGLRGNILSNAPKWSATASAAYETRLAGQWSGYARADGRFQSSVLTASNLAAPTLQTSYAIINARIGVKSADGFEFALFGTNIANKQYQTIAFATTGGYQSYFGEPRYYGLEIAKRF